ncbi:MAG: toxin-antitoxin system HicB family antitoxin [Cyanobacteria bacterium J06598_3]
MSTLTVRLPESLHAKIKELAQAEGISINQFLVVAAAEKMSALLTEDYLQREAEKGDRQSFERFMQKVPDIEPEKYDRR